MKLKLGKIEHVARLEESCLDICEHFFRLYGAVRHEDSLLHVPHITSDYSGFLTRRISNIDSSSRHRSASTLLIEMEMWTTQLDILCATSSSCLCKIRARASADL